MYLDPRPTVKAEFLHPHASVLFTSDLVNQGVTEKGTAWEVLDHTVWGRTLRLDNCTQLTDMDEPVYHNAMVEVPLQLLADVDALPTKAKVLILGGGDCLTALRLYEAGCEVKMVEYDLDVIHVSQKYILTIEEADIVTRALAGELADFRIVIGDAYLYLKLAAVNSDERYNLIVSDLTDPIGDADILYSSKMLDNCYQLLTDIGVFSTHLGSLVYSTERTLADFEAVAEIFDSSDFGCYDVPSYGGSWTFAYGVKAPTMETWDSLEWIMPEEMRLQAKRELQMVETVEERREARNGNR